MSTDELTLGADFPAATAEQWRRLALAALRRSGAATEATGPDDVDGLLATGTYDGITLDALYTADSPPTPATGLPGRWPYVRGTRADATAWDVRAHHDRVDAEAVVADLENGVTSIWLAVGADGVPVDALPDALDGVYLDLARVVLDPGDGFTAAADAWFRLLAARGVDPARVTGGLGADPVGHRARTGDATGLAPALRDAGALAVRCAGTAPGVRAVTVDATVYHDAGGSDSEELGCATATGVAYLRALTDAGLPAEAALGMLEFRYAATADQFATIAKLRAARRIWARVAQLCGAPAAGGQHQHAVTSAAMMTARDPWVNLLRTTVAAFAAGVGGAEAVTVRPYDHRLGRPGPAARRLARNTQTLLIEEAQVARVLDPAGGSWYVERYTEELARAAWDWFTALEKAGGIAAALDSGLVADRLAATWQRRADNIAHRRDPITGVSEFPNLAEPVPPRPAASAPTAGGLPRHHWAEAYERLRDRSDAHLAATGRRPTVVLTVLGTPAAAGPRITFTTNLFAAGGIDVTTDASTVTGPVVACLCGSDKAYAEEADPAVTALRDAGARRIWLAGRGEYSDVDGYLHVGGNAVAALTATLADLEVAP